MNNLNKALLPAAVAGLCLFVAVSCSNAGHEDAKEQAKETNDEKFEDRDTEKDADRLVDAYCANLYEIKASENAAMKATTTDVKKLAGMMVVAHTKMNTDLQALAAKKNVTLPGDITDGQRRDMENLTEKSGLDYDKEYTSQMKDKHEDAIKRYDRAADKAEDPEIKQWAATTVTEVRTHLEMIEATYNNVKDMKEAEKERKTEKNTWEGKSGMHDGKENVHDDDHKKH
jgi:putative membrane protein